MDPTEIPLLPGNCPIKIFPCFVTALPVGNSLIPNLTNLMEEYFFEVSVMSPDPEYAAMESNKAPPDVATFAILKLDNYVLDGRKFTQHGPFVAY